MLAGKRMLRWWWREATRRINTEKHQKNSQNGTKHSQNGTKNSQNGTKTTENGTKTTENAEFGAKSAENGAKVAGKARQPLPVSHIASLLTLLAVPGFVDYFYLFINFFKTKNLVFFIYKLQ
jgi:hypothetical protein